MKTYLPTSAKEVAALGWDSIDVILFTGDAYVDHPSFGAAVIGRTLTAAGYRVAIVPQPNWRDDLRDFRKLGVPRLFFGVSAGAMDSMVNHYTATRRLRSDDAYTPGGKAGMRPDYPTIVYSQIIKKIYPDSLVVIGGIEASLRRLTHFDYWQDKLRPSVLVDSGADLLTYGMGEKVVIELAHAIERGEDWRQVNQIAYISCCKQDGLLLNSFEKCVGDKKAYGENFVKIEIESNKMEAATLVEPVGNKFVVVNPPYPYLTETEIDASFDLPYTRLPHPRYWGKGAIPAYEMIKHSVNLHRGCFGGCSFCTISAHQGKFISSRSEKSILKEVEDVTKMADFRGNLSDIGGPSANMWRMSGTDKEKCQKCARPSCIFPKVCLNLNNDHRPLMRLYERIRNVKGVKRAFIGSGIRYDMFDETPYLETVLKYHTSGRFKVAPEHTEDKVLKLMRKPSFSLFTKMHADFKRICEKEQLPYQLIPYFISSHPSCEESDMRALATKTGEFHLEQVQDFTPTPMTLSTTIYYTGENPYSGEKIYTAHTKEQKDRQKSFFFGKPTSNQHGRSNTDKTVTRKTQNKRRPYGN